MLPCVECQGRGEIFAGAEMRPNPYDYSDYNEIWMRCDFCGGSGKSMKPKNIYWYFLWWWRGVVERRRWKKQDSTEDIPF